MYRGLMSLFRTQAREIKFSDGDIKKGVQLLRCGTFYDARYGKLDVTSATLLSMKKNFDDKVRGVDLSIDYKHESDDIAAGWITDVYLANNNTELWAKVDWTPNGQRVLADKEFRYLSADFIFDYQDNETLQKFGPTLFGAGLTNRPVVKNMEPAIELHELTPQGRARMTEIEKLQADLKAEQEKNKTLSEQLAAPKPAAAAAAAVDPDAKADDDLKKQIEDLKAQLAAMQVQNAEYAKQCKEMQDKAQLAEKKAKFQALLSEGRAVPAQEDAFLKDDMIKFAELSGAVNLHSQGHNGTPPAPAAGSVDDQILALASKKLAEDKSLDIKKATSLVLKENPVLANQRRAKAQA